MKPKLLYIATLCVFTLQVSAALKDYTESHPLLLGMDMDYPPLEYIDENGTPQGLDIVFTKELMKRLDIPFTYSPNTWENISEDVLSGRVDLGMMVYSPYRKNLTNYSRAIFRLYYQILFRKDSKGHFDVRHLAGKKVAYMASRPIKDTLTKVGAILYEVKNLSEATKHLSEGRYDAVICFRYQSNYLIEKYDLRNLESEDLTLVPREYCYVSHDKELIERINTELEKMEDEGFIDEVYGEVAKSFGEFRVPDWVWYLLLSLVVVFLMVFIVFQQRYQKRLRAEMERAQRNEQLKTAFLGNISHALRTPLNAIIGFSQILDDDKDNQMSPNDRHQLLELINGNGKQLLRFINDLLYLSEVHGDAIAFKHTEVYLKDTLASYLDECRADLTPGVELRLEGDNLRALVDEKYLRIVTKQFLSNAVKYTIQGSITLRYFPINDGLRVEVQDTGTGVPEALRDNIFNLLYNQATFVQDEVPGLGLTICKAIVDNSNGHIGVLSPESGGAVFWYWVPVKVFKE